MHALDMSGARHDSVGFVMRRAAGRVNGVERVVRFNGLRTREGLTDGAGLIVSDIGLGVLVLRRVDYP